MMLIDLADHGTLTLPDQLLVNLREVHGNRVDRWLKSLGALLRGVLEEMDASVAAGDPPLSYHLVFFATRSSGEEIVIKATVPNHEQPPEVAAVEALSTAGIGPQLLWHDLDRGVLVMERIRPGETLPTHCPTLAEDAENTTVLASLARHMADDIPVDRRLSSLVPVFEYSHALEEVDRHTSLWRQHRDDIELALYLRNRLLRQSDSRHVFVHGDLHHYNVIANNGNAWRVIDPKGLVGPRAFEFGALVYNPVGIHHHPDLEAIERQRVDIWSEISGLPWETVRSWGYIAAVLSACWAGQHGGSDWRDAMTVATTLRGLAPVR